MSRPQITCHILDTSSGKPAANVPCELYYLSGGLAATADSKPMLVGTGVTNADGRVVGWDCSKSSKDQDGGIVGAIAEAIEKHSGLIPGHYKIRFIAKEYFEAKSNKNSQGNADVPFFPFIEVVFSVAKVTDEHYHIPLLLSNYSYSTYRGS